MTTSELSVLNDLVSFDQTKLQDKTATWDRQRIFARIDIIKQCSSEHLCIIKLSSKNMAITRDCTTHAHMLEGVTVVIYSTSCHDYTCYQSMKLAELPNFLSKNNPHALSQSSTQRSPPHSPTRNWPRRDYHHGNRKWEELYPADKDREHCSPRNKPSYTTRTCAWELKYYIALKWTYVASHCHCFMVQLLTSHCGHYCVFNVHIKCVCILDSNKIWLCTHCINIES